MTQSTVNRLREHALQLARVSAHNADDFCRYYENAIVSIGERAHAAYPRIPAINGPPPWHPNCQHALTPFVERLGTEEETKHGVTAPDLLNRPAAELQRRFRKEFPAAAEPAAGARQQPAQRQRGNGAHTTSQSPATISPARSPLSARRASRSTQRCGTASLLTRRCRASCRPQ